jgi:hypothetical protein
MDEDWVIFRDGTTANPAVLKMLWDIEDRGGRFVLTGETGYRIEPDGLLTYTQRIFLLQYRDEVRRLVRYQADDAHLTGFPAPMSLDLN